MSINSGSRRTEARDLLANSAPAAQADRDAARRQLRLLRHEEEAECVRALGLLHPLLLARRLLALRTGER